MEDVSFHGRSSPVTVRPDLLRTGKIKSEEWLTSPVRQTQSHQSIVYWQTIKTRPGLIGTTPPWVSRCSGTGLVCGVVWSRMSFQFRVSGVEFTVCCCELWVLSLLNRESLDVNREFLFHLTNITIWMKDCQQSVLHSLCKTSGLTFSAERLDICILITKSAIGRLLNLIFIIIILLNTK